MPEKRHSCPNCEAVMTLRYDPTEADVAWFECPICGHRADAKDFRSVEAEDWETQPSSF